MNSRQTEIGNAMCVLAQHLTQWNPNLNLGFQALPEYAQE